METNAITSLPIESTESFSVQGMSLDLTSYPEKKKQITLDNNIFTEKNVQEEIMDLQESNWRQNETKERMKMEPMYRIGGSVESIFSQTSILSPGWTILKSSKSQDAIGSNSSFIQNQKWPSQQNELESPEIVDDVVGDEIKFKLPRQQSQEKKIDYRHNIFKVPHSLSHSSLVTYSISSPEFLQNDTISEDQKCSWKKATDLSPVPSEETESDHSQAAEFDGSQNISISLLKSILMEREFKINDLSKEIKRVQTENLHLLEEKQHVISENENLRREFEAMTFEKERKQQDVFHSFDPSSPLVLQRQIMNLKNQINDLQEANENAVLELSKADEEISQQRKDLTKLKSEYSQNLEDSQEEIKILTEKISQISSRLTQPENYQEGLHKEIAQLRSECRRLRTQSHELSEENHHLKEDLWDLKMHHERLLAGKTDELSMENDWAASFFTGPFVGKLYSKNWRTEENRNDAINVDGTFSKCKAALNSVNIKEPWESRHEERFKQNSSPFSMNSENTEVLIMASEDSFHKPSQTHTSGDACEDIHELSYDGDLSSVSHVRDNVLSNSSHSPKTSLLCDSSSKTAASKRPHLSMLPRRPFAPKNVGDLKLGDLVKFSRPGGKISKGTIQYKGHLPGRMEVYLGVELEGGELGKHDGIFQGVRYFLCKPNKGVFVNFSKIIMAWN